MKKCIRKVFVYSHAYVFVEGTVIITRAITRAAKNMEYIQRLCSVHRFDNRNK